MRKHLKEIIRRVEFWPEDRQENAAKVLLEMEAQASSVHRLTDEHAEEVKRRMSDFAPRFLPLQEARSRFAKRCA
jgi:hypothetical protein